jgi:uncharacterized protein YecE (DUF72 family)
MWDRVTTDMVYIRLHGDTRKYASNYNKPALKRWTMRTRRWLKENGDVHVYFDNDAEGAAPRNALTLLEMVRRAVQRLLLDDQPRLWSARTCPRF